MSNGDEYFVKVQFRIENLYLPGFRKMKVLKKVQFGAILVPGRRSPKSKVQSPKSVQRASKSAFMAIFKKIALLTVTDRY
jgi:hypothetical protein